MTLPNDPAILYSMLNTKLRDQSVSLTELCDDLDIGRRQDSCMTPESTSSGAGGEKAPSIDQLDIDIEREL